MYPNEAEAAGQVRDYIISHREEMVEALVGLINIPSVSDHKPEVQRSLEYVLDLAKKMGLKAESLLNGQIGRVEIGEGDETLGILVHVDVVPAGDPKTWHSNPFKAEIKDGAIYGRGAIDDKGPTIACLYAMKAVDLLPVKLHKKVQLIIGTQEEVEWTDIDEYVKHYQLPDYGFSPDGVFPICNIEKGIATAKILFPFKAPKEGIISINGGTAANVVPGYCAALMQTGGKFEQIFENGVEAHSCQPENGDNAILKLCRRISEMKIGDDQIQLFCRYILKYFSDMECSGIGLRTENEYFNGEYIHRNILAPTMIQTNENQIELVIDLRFVWGVTKDEIKSAIEKVAKAIDCEAELPAFMPAVYVSRESPFLKEMSNAYEYATGKKAAYSMEFGATYAKAMPNIVSWGPQFPGEKDSSHSANEHMMLKSLLLNGEIFAEAIRRIASSHASLKWLG